MSQTQSWDPWRADYQDPDEPGGDDWLHERLILVEPFTTWVPDASPSRYDLFANIMRKMRLKALGTEPSVSAFLDDFYEEVVTRYAADGWNFAAAREAAHLAVLELTWKEFRSLLVAFGWDDQITVTGTLVTLDDELRRAFAQRFASRAFPRRRKKARPSEQSRKRQQAGSSSRPGQGSRPGRSN